LSRHFEAETRERGTQIELEEAAAGDGTAGDNVEVPIFICSLAMPSVACPLHVFEPRYRLMMRRCIDSGQRQFGMCLHPEAEYGTMLRILEFEQLPDGRSRIKTIGSRRFQVLEWGTKDGYSTGRVRWVDDSEEELVPVGISERGDDEGEPVNKSARSNDGAVAPELLQLKKHVDGLFNMLSSRPEGRAYFEEQVGALPPVDGRDGPYCPAFVFWSAAVAGLPPRRAYELCFSDDTRHSPSKRAKAVLAHFERKLSASEQRFESSDSAGYQGAGEDDEDDE